MGRRRARRCGKILPTSIPDLLPFAQETGAWASVVAYSVILAVAWWYLYRKPGVVAYYRILDQQAKRSVQNWVPVE